MPKQQDQRSVKNEAIAIDAKAISPAATASSTGATAINGNASMSGKGNNNSNANEETGENVNVNPSNVIASTAKEVDVAADNEKRVVDEMNIFSAMVNGNMGSGLGSSNHSLDDWVLTEEQKRSKGMDSNYATDEDKDGNISSDAIMKQQQEEERRRSEMNAFAAMANAGFHVNSLEDDDSDVDAHDDEDAEDDDKKQVEDRSNEINAFAAMANGIYHGESPTSNGGSDVDADGYSKDRSNEINSFAAMANGNYNTPGTASNGRKEDSKDRSNEINAFAAMANGDYTMPESANTGRKDDFKDRSNEINAFAAMANGDYNVPDTASDGGSDIEKSSQRPVLEDRSNEINAFAAMANGDYNMPTNTNHDDGSDVENSDQKQVLEDRSNEINAFAAMANGNFAPQSNDDDGNETESASQFQVQENQRVQNEMSAFAAMANGEWNPNAFGSDAKGKDKGMGGEGAGSMVYNSSKKTKNEILGAGSFIADSSKMKEKSENKNLNAALAMIENDAFPEDKKQNQDATKVATPIFPTFDASTQRKPVCDQLYFERVLVQRPLFFGTVIPERMQKVIETGEEDEPDSTDYNLSLAPKDDDPVSCRNLRGAIEAFGSLSLGRGGRGSDDEPLAMNSHISLYEPVWGDAARLRREDRIMERLGEDFKDSDDDVTDATVSDTVHEGDTHTIPLDGGTMSTITSPTASRDGDVTHDTLSPQGSFKDPSSDLSENMFLQYARGSSNGLGGTFVGAKGTLVSVPESDTLRNVPNAKGSFESSELKKHIGLNDNLSRALESLDITGGAGGTSSVSFGMVEGGEAAAAAIQTTIATVKGGRPLSNLEIMNGKVPLYGCDDDPLPNRIDLFIPDTKRDEIRWYEQCESEEIISQAVPNIFGPLVCPSHCSGPNDSQSWFSRRRGPSLSDSDLVAVNDLENRTHRSNKSFDSIPNRSGNRSVIPSPLPLPPLKGTLMRNQSDASTRITENASSDASFRPNAGRQHFNEFCHGWWNSEKMHNQKASNDVDETSSSTGDLQLPPIREKLRKSDYGTQLLKPSQKDVLLENQSLSELHPAIDTVSQMPLLSDRPLNTRFIQIETQVVGFRDLVEIEPLFCSIAIWHVEPRLGEFEQPFCGRVTESLSFDVVNSTEVEEKFKSVLWPFSTNPNEGETFKEEDRSQSTRCGLFPIPSCYDMKNLFAVIIVEKVLGENSDLDIYWNDEGDNTSPDLSKCRDKASKAADRVGHITTPFAFGVALLGPLVGLEPPAVPKSNAAQVPLFKLQAGEGEDYILNHIFAMLQPRSRFERTASAAEVTNKGTAMLVIRNFGYLGPHCAISRGSKLIRDRLVDFTREVQVRRRREGETSTEPDDDDGRICVSEKWHDAFIAEPAPHGGRCEEMTDDSNLYVQEVAPIPLPIRHLNPRNRKHLSMRSRYYTSICNEFIIQPVNIEYCWKRNLTVKLEVVRLVFREDLGAIVAIPVKNCIHNSRRGPHLVREQFTSCAYHKIDPYFLDEMKLKLPLTNLKSKKHGTLVALFTVFHVSVKGKKKWALKSSNINDAPLSSLEEIASGYLSLSSGEKCTYLIEDGLHPVHLKFKTKSLSEHPHASRCNLPNGTKILEASGVQDQGRPASSKSGSGLKEGPTSKIDEFLQNTASRFYNSPDSHDDSYSATELQSVQSTISSLTDVNEFKQNSDVSRPKTRKGLKDQKPRSPNAILNVRTISLSSVHPQNEALEDFFSFLPKAPRQLEDIDFVGAWSKGKNQIEKELYQIRQKLNQPPASNGTGLSQSVTAITNGAVCPQPQLVSHFVRISFQLWRILVAGDGKPSLAFASPSMPAPLRIQAFSTLLYVLNSVISYLAKCNVAEASGSQKWNVGTMGCLISILFDEESIFLDPNNRLCEDWSALMKKDQDFDAKKSDEISPLSDTKADFDGCNQFPSEGRGLPKRSVMDELNSSLSSNPLPGSAGIGLIATDLDSRQESSPLKLSPGSQDDIVLKGEMKPAPLRTRSLSAPSAKQLKIDTKSDFQFALSSSISPTSSNNSHFGNGVQSGPAAARRKWLSGSVSLATISEDNDNAISEATVISPLRGSVGLDGLDTEIVLHDKKSKPSKVKQMRVPKVKKHSFSWTEDDLKEVTLQSIEDLNSEDNDSESSSMTIPKMDEIETAGTAFLDRIGQNYGYSNAMELGGEERRVGVAHHRKTKSRCSIDWTLPPTDFVIENHQQMEILNRGKISAGLKDKVQSSDVPLVEEKMRSADATKGKKDPPQIRIDSSAKGEIDSSNRTAKDNCSFCKGDQPVCLPSFMDRLVYQGNNHGQGRWFPYTYEVIIFQWVALLTEQVKDKRKRKGRPPQPNSYSPLAEAAERVQGISIKLAPILLGVIKKSLGFRIDSLSQMYRQNTAKSSDQCLRGNHLVDLDSSLLSTIETLITMLTDATLDNRNFESWSVRYVSMVVNDSIARFLRDLFAFLDPNLVRRLVLVYFSRFVLKDGKRWQDRNSDIGLQSSYEVSKMRLNAVTTFIRVLDFVKLNNPLMETWGDWTLRSPTRTNRHLFSDAINELQALSMNSFADITPTSRDSLEIPEWESHWLVELVTDICLSATSHNEQIIKNRAAALLYELFWMSNAYGKVQRSSTVVSSLYLTFIPKLLGHVSYLSTLSPKCDLRKDLLPCFIFVLQSAPFGLLRELWRKLCKQTEGKGTTGNYGGIKNVAECENADKHEDDKPKTIPEDSESNNKEHYPCILDLCSLLNLSLTTLEYEGSESNVDNSAHHLLSQWHAEYLLAPENDPPQKRKPNTGNSEYVSTSSRKWNAHDAATVTITTCRSVVREYVSMLNFSKNDRARGNVNGPIASFSNNPIAASRTRTNKETLGKGIGELQFSFEDRVIFLRAVASVYLNCLSLRQSDVVLIKTLLASTEILKVFGIELFLTAVGETLQHWMRVILVHCGARRAKVRVEALDFLALILRLQWDTFGSFTRVRIPLLATMTEVMERVVATAAARYYRQQKRENTSIQYLSNIKAEAALTPLWRTLTRLHDGSASNNAAFKSALQLLANKMKKLYKSYIAAHALAIVNRTNENASSTSPTDCFTDGSFFETTQVVRESGAEFSKKILGYNQVTKSDCRGMVIHNEFVEDAFLAAANVFSPTELPLHRVAWLRKLAEFHSSRARSAEQAACRLEIYKTLRQASALHEGLWNSKPFWPWANEASDGTLLNKEGPTGTSGDEYDEVDANLQDERSQSFRRIFYRIANSVRMRTGDWWVGGGGTKTLFYGVTFASEYTSVASWIALREIDTEMVEEAEHAGELFLRAGIVESSRLCWGLATQFHSNMYNYARLAYCYRKLSHVVASQVPTVDTKNQLEISSPLGRFYRVHFHGGAANEYIQKEFIYRAPVNVKLEEFCKNIKHVLKSIIHEKSQIDLVLDDGRASESKKRNKIPRRPLGQPAGESTTIKVTPLKPLLNTEKCPRGSAEWFYKQTEIADFTFPRAAQSVASSRQTSPSSNSVKSHRPYSSKSSNMNSFGRPVDSHKTFRTLNNRDHITSGGGEEIGVYKFSYTQPRDRQRSCRDLLRAPNGDFSEKALRVTELSVSESMPNCVSRQPVAVGNRSVFNQSPLEAGVEAVCSWCAVLFRTAVATNGLAVIGNGSERGIGRAALRNISECIHNSKVREIGLSMLTQNEADPNRFSSYETLTEEEVTLNQVKLARAIVICMELLHVLISRNRDILKAVNRSRKRDTSSNGSYSIKEGLQYGMPPSPNRTSLFHHETFNSRTYDDISCTIDGGCSRTSGMDRTDKAMAVQRELQIAFVKLTKDLHPPILSVIRSETPKWMKQICCQADYFSSNNYRQTRIAIGEELLFFGNPSDETRHGGNADVDTYNTSFGVPLSILPRTSDHGSYVESESSRTSSRGSQSATMYTL